MKKYTIFLKWNVKVHKEHRIMSNCSDMKIDKFKIVVRQYLDSKKMWGKEHDPKKMSEQFSKLYGRYPINERL